MLSRPCLYAWYVPSAAGTEETFVYRTATARIPLRCRQDPPGPECSSGCCAPARCGGPGATNAINDASYLALSLHVAGKLAGIASCDRGRNLVHTCGASRSRVGPGPRVDRVDRARIVADTNTATSTKTHTQRHRDEQPCSERINSTDDPTRRDNEYPGHLSRGAGPRSVHVAPDTLACFVRA